MNQSDRQQFSATLPIEPNFLGWLYSLWKFSRPHTIIGTSLSVLGLYAIALAVNGNWEFFPLSLPPHWQQLLGAWIACLLGNIYIVGLNQLEDIAIDRINKPHLPVAAGEFSVRQAQSIVAIAGIFSLLIAAEMSPFLLCMVAISLAIGTAYSLPPIRLKRFPFWAAICILTVRGTVVNIGLFLHFNWAWQNQPFIPASVWTLSIFIVVFTLAIALGKDLPDIEGDRQYNIVTFSIQLGAKTVFDLIRWFITASYAGIIIAAIFLPEINFSLTLASHSLLLIFMWWRSFRVDLQDKQAIASFYQFIWKLFFLEYLLFPLACF